MSRVWDHWRARITEGYLRELRASAQARIDNGDLDFDDLVYRQRDAARTLLDIRDGVRQEDES